MGGRPPPPAPCLDRMFVGPEQTVPGGAVAPTLRVLGGGVTCRPWLCLRPFTTTEDGERNRTLSALFPPQDPGHDGWEPAGVVGLSPAARPRPSSPSEMPPSLTQGRTAPSTTDPPPPSVPVGVPTDSLPPPESAPRPPADYPSLTWELPGLPGWPATSLAGWAPACSHDTRPPALGRGSSPQPRFRGEQTAVQPHAQPGAVRRPDSKFPRDSSNSGQCAKTAWPWDRKERSEKTYWHTPDPG